MKKIIILLGFLSVAGLAYSEYTPILYYSFDNSSNLGADSSGNNHNLSGTATYSASGAIGGAASFNGTSDMLATGDFAQNAYIDGAFTIATWASLNSTAQQQLGGMQYSYYGVSGEIFGIYAGTFRPFVYGVDENNAGKYQNVPSYHTPTNDWTHYAMAYTPSEHVYTDLAGNKSYLGTLKLYVDGVLKNTNESIYFKTNAQAGFQMGKADWMIDGMVDDMAMWNIALSDSEISSLADQSFTPMTVPEPATITMLGLGGLLLTKRKTHSRSK